LDYKGDCAEYFGNYALYAEDDEMIVMDDGLWWCGRGGGGLWD